MKPFFLSTHYWELPWIYPIAKRTGWPVMNSNDVIFSFCKKNKLKIIEQNEVDIECDKVIVVTPHFGRQRDFVTSWVGAGKKAYLLQRAFDSSIAVYDTFWNMNMNLFTKYLVASKFDYELLQPKRGDRVVITGSPRLFMAVQALNKNLDDIYRKVGTKDFYVATVIGGLPMHEDSLPSYYMNELPKKSPFKIIFKLHSDANLQYHLETYPSCQFWVDSKEDVWETYKLIAASRGVITPSSFMAIEATIMGKPVILEGDVHPDEYNRQSQERQRDRLPRSMSSTLANPIFTQEQEKIRDSYKYDKASTDRVIYEILN